MNEFAFGTFIKKRRKELGMSQEKLCEGFCSIPNLSRIENNLQEPTREMARNLLGRLGLSGEHFFSLWTNLDIDTGALVREIRANLVKYRQSSNADRIRIKLVILEELSELEKQTNPEDRVIKQFLLSHRAILGEPGRAYRTEEKLAMQLEAIRLTCPQFDPVDFRDRYFTMDESTLINQIANTYAALGDRKRAIDIYRQLLWYTEKNFKELSEYPNHFCLIAHNYAIDLTLESRFPDAIEVAEHGRKVCLKYVDYQFLPGFLAIQAECLYFLNKEEESKKLYLKAYNLYEAFEDQINMDNMRREVKKHLRIEI